tara:strand:+ start:16983 stop:17192 length:210 start_codon:yes stop_codon:yes gene_type:complete
MSDIHQCCPNCLEDGNLLKIPPVASIFTKSEQQSRLTRTGDLVREFIEDAKGELQEERQNLRKQEYKPE